MSSITKFCVDCEHSRVDSNTQKATCVLCPVGKPDPVWGYAEYQHCAVVRRPGGSCGPEGKMFNHA